VRRFFKPGIARRRILPAPIAARPFIAHGNSAASKRMSASGKQFLQKLSACYPLAATQATISSEIGPKPAATSRRSRKAEATPKLHASDERIQPTTQQLPVQPPWPQFPWPIIGDQRQSRFVAEGTAVRSCCHDSRPFCRDIPWSASKNHVPSESPAYTRTPRRWPSTRPGWKKRSTVLEVLAEP